MSVPSLQFLVYAIVASLLVNISRSHIWRATTLLLANCLFVLTFIQSPLQLVPLVSFLLLGFSSVKLLGRSKSKRFFFFLIGTLILAFCWLKQFAFVPQELILKYPYFVVGLSYIFFRVLHLAIDSFQDTLPGKISLLSYINYTLSFTSLVSGPIQLYADFCRNEQGALPTLNEPALGRALERIVTGLFKVIVLSPILEWVHNFSVRAIDPATSPAWRSVAETLVLSIYPILLYTNFSGYTDFVIGCARLLRLELPENFKRPFAAKGFLDFWSRWHITLSNWLKMYVYSPLLLSLIRRFPSRKAEAWLGVASYFVTFFLIGVWHGSTLAFVVYGLLLGLGVAGNKVFQILMLRQLGRKTYRTLSTHFLFEGASRGLTFVWFSFSLLWFWSSPAQLDEFGAKLGIIPIICGLLLTFVASSVTLSALEVLDHTFREFSLRRKLIIGSWELRTAWCTALAMCTISVIVLFNAPTPHIIYKAF